MKQYKLKDLLEIKNGRDYKHLSDGDIPVYGSGGLMRFVNKSLCENESILLPRKGTLSNIQYVNKPFWTVDTIYYTIINKELAEPYFLYQYLKILDLSHLNTGTGVPSMTFGAYYDVPILLPDLHKQKQIAKVLSDLDAKIELNNKINAELEGMAKLIYDYWFVQFNFPDKNGKPYKTSGGKMVYNQDLKREIPEGWEVKELSDCIDLIIDHRGKTPKKLGSDWTDNENGIIALSAKVVKGGKLVNLKAANKVDEQLYKKWMRDELIDGDILMTSEAPAGEFYFLHGFTKYCMSQRLFCVRADKSQLVPSYLYYELSKGHGYSQIMGGLSGSTVFGIRQEGLRKIKVVIPPLVIQKQFDAIVLPQLQKIRTLDKQNQHLSSLRDWLLPMLMNGQVRVA